jgi:membrane fusion protein (multidrug efflux system)
VVFHGRVIGLSAGTGAAFSLLPPQNASGNWIKVTQRLPVKIVLDPQELAAHPLRIGLSTTTVVDTHDRDGAVLAADPVSDVHETTTSYTLDSSAAEQAALKIIRSNAGRG